MATCGNDPGLIASRLGAARSCMCGSRRRSKSSTTARVANCSTRSWDASRSQPPAA
jgi:hypothetical protein